jgi:hypothetical protein
VGEERLHLGLGERVEPRVPERALRREARPHNECPVVVSKASDQRGRMAIRDGVPQLPRDVVEALHEHIDVTAAREPGRGGVVEVDVDADETMGPDAVGEQLACRPDELVIGDATQEAPADPAFTVNEEEVPIAPWAEALGLDRSGENGTSLLLAPCLDECG